MSGLHEKFDEIVADVPVYGDLDRAIEQADREQRHLHGVVAGLVAAAAVVAVIVGVLAATGGGNRSQQPVDPVTQTETKSQSPQTWADTPVAATGGRRGWHVPDPLKGARDAWLPIVVEHLGPQGAEPGESFESDASFERPADGSEYDARTPATSVYPTYGGIGLMVGHGELNPFDDGCRYLGTPTPGTESCSTERFEGPAGERARISRWGRRCGAYEGGGPAPATCGDYKVAVAVERRDGLIGVVDVEGRGTPDFNPFTSAAMAAAAADPRLTLPETAYAVPSDQAVMSVVEDHFPNYRTDEQDPSPTVHPGYGRTSGKLGRLGLTVSVSPAGETPACGRSWLIACVERRVFGADDPTTVFVGAWDEEDWADSGPKNSRADSREFVYVGPRHTVVVYEFLIVKADEEPISAGLDQRLIDLLLDPRLQ